MNRPFTKGKIAVANAFIFYVVLGREVRANECTLFSIIHELTGRIPDALQRHTHFELADWHLGHVHTNIWG